MQQVGLLRVQILLTTYERMSENENQPTAPSKQTSSVPLKKETVRITLKASDAPPASPSATIPMAPPVRPPVPGGAPRPLTAPPTVPLRPAVGAPAMSPVKSPGMSSGITPAPTIPLRASVALPGTIPAPTVRISPVGLPTLPKATVPLQKTSQPLEPSSKIEPLEVAGKDASEAEEGQLLVNVLSGIGLAAALVVLALQFMTASKWINAEDNPKAGQWSQLSPF